jgi:transposase-like protein
MKTKSKTKGRPTKYKPECCDQAYKLCLIGYTDKELSKFFGVSESTLNKWKIDFSDFSEAIRNGKEKADMEIVSELYNGARDRVVLEQTAIKLKNVSWKDGKKWERETVEIVSIEKVIPGDFRNQQFWLKNRQKNFWRDKIETGITDSEGNDVPMPMTALQFNKMLSKINGNTQD